MPAPSPRWPCTWTTPLKSWTRSRGLCPCGCCRAGGDEVSADGPAPLPDETPVEALGLRQYTINALRAGYVLTLGELRAMRDRDLMALRTFGRAALAGVRSLVPPPEADGP